ncbi:hypothetical protein OMCYN_01684 [cyanobiont of Ornithocercus magnificus]|nr:hypothetical protein OMCYN_01684 [cyanobiont of Ornithocercus magnificus]
MASHQIDEEQWQMLLDLLESCVDNNEDAHSVAEIVAAREELEKAGGGRQITLSEFEELMKTKWSKFSDL